jgi:hypothetical protein
MKCEWYSFFWGHLHITFHIKLNTHCSNLNSIFVTMSKLEFFLFTGSSLKTPTSWNFKKTSHSNHSGHIEDDIT